MIPRALLALQECWSVRPSKRQEYWRERRSEGSPHMRYLTLPHALLPGYVNCEPVSALLGLQQLAESVWLSFSARLKQNVEYHAVDRRQKRPGRGRKGCFPK